MGRSGGSDAYMMSNTYFDQTNYKYVASLAAARYTQSSGEHQWFNAASGTAGNTISFAQAMTLSASGELLVGLTTAAIGERLSVTGKSGNVECARFIHNGNYSALNVNAASATFADNVIYSTTDRAANAAFQFFRATANTVDQFRVTGNGVIYAQNTTVQSISDVRTKENIVNATEGLDVITALRPVRFDFKEGFGNERKNQLGFIAQEIETVFPDAVDVWGESDNPDEPYKSVGPAALIPVLVKAIQEQQAIIQTLTDRITALEQA